MMSSYTTKARNKETGEIVDVNCFDDCFGRHQYGYQLNISEDILTQKQFDEHWEEVK